MRRHGFLISNILSILLVPSLLQAQTAADCDFDVSGIVDFADFLLFAQNFGKCKAEDSDFDSVYDISKNGCIDFPDFLIVTKFYGQQNTLRSRYEGEFTFGWVDGSEPDMPVWDTSLGGWKHQAGDTRSQIVIDETFTVAAGDRRTFDNQMVWIRPGSRNDITIHGTLIVKNSLLLWDQTEHQQTRLRIKNGGTLQIENSYSFSHNSFWVNWEFESGSTVDYKGFAGDPWTVIHGSVDYAATHFSTVKMTFLNDTQNTRVRVEDAHHVWFEVFPPEGKTVEISFPEKHRWIDWDVNSMWPDTVVEVRDSYLYERDISLSNNTHVTVRDTPSGFSVGWAVSHHGNDFITCEIRDLGDPDTDSGVFYTNKVWNLPETNSSLTVINSKLQRAWPVCWGNVHLKVYHSNLVDPRVFGGPATFEIYDCTIDHIAAYSQAKVYLENSRIRYDIEVKDTDTFIYGYKVSRRDTDRRVKVIEVDGGQYIELDSSGVPW